MVNGTKVKQNKNKLTDYQKKKIIADYVESGNKSEVARKHGVSETTVRNLVKANKDCLEKFEQKKEENTQDVLEFMDSLKNRKKTIIEKLLKAIENKADNLDNFTSIKDVASAYGIIIDKELKLKEIKSKNNNNDDGGVVIVNDLPKSE